MTHLERTALALSSLTLAGAPALAQDSPEHGHVPALVADIRVLEELFPGMALCHWVTNPDATAFAYADWRGTIRQIVTVDGGLKENWRSFPLDSPVRELQTADVNGDGHQEIIAWTRDSRIYVWTTLGYELLWDSTNEDLGTIQALAMANVDADPQLEFVLCSNNRIVLYDGVGFFLEKTGREEIRPLDMAVADVDADGEPEIITSDGHIIDSTSLNIEWSTEPFGYPLVLFDIDSNGVPEVVSHARGGVRFWNVQQRRELW
jgi:hypothetical protein